MLFRESGGVLRAEVASSEIAWAFLRKDCVYLTVELSIKKAPRSEKRFQQ